MGIYIEGMEMPKTCRDCEYCWVRKNTKSCDAKYGLPIGNRCGIERASFYPLTEVPEPHVRLIDADALIPMMKYATTDSEVGIFPIKIGFDAIEKVIEEAPTIAIMTYNPEHGVLDIEEGTLKCYPEFKVVEPTKDAVKVVRYKEGGDTE